jgi:hypothetical protein
MSKKSNAMRYVTETHLTLLGWIPIHQTGGMRWERGYGLWQPETGRWMTRNQNANYVTGSGRMSPQPSLCPVEWNELRNGLFWVCVRKLSERGHVTVP